MQSRSRNYRFVETLEARRLMSSVAYGDFNNDGLVDQAAVTDTTTITVSLAKPDGGYTVSATLKSGKNQPIGDIYVGDYNNDGKLDISSGSGSGGTKFSITVWLGNGDGTFGNAHTQNSKPAHGGF